MAKKETKYFRKQPARIIKKNVNNTGSITIFEEKLAIFEDRIFNGKQKVITDVEKQVLMGNLRECIVFLSVCDVKTRAQVYKGNGESVKEAWKHAVGVMKTGLKNQENYNPLWLKVDIVDSVKEINPLDLNRFMKNIHFAYFYRKGIALDADFNVAFLEEELNGNKLLTYYSLDDMELQNIDFNSNRLNLRNMNHYLKSYYGKSSIEEIPDIVFEFTTQSFFYDEKSDFYDLYNRGVDKGRRRISKVTDEVVLDTITKASRYLHDLIDEDGKFIYGYFPIFGREMKNYNILRHTSSLWSLINLYRMTKDNVILRKLDLAVEYMVQNNISYKDEETAFLVEKNVNEIKLGGNGLALIMLTEYMDVLKSDKYATLVKCLANGVMYMQNQDGTFVHVLDATSFEVKERYRIVYYEGEAVFGLARAYSVLKINKYLQAATLGVENFIARNYIQYTDHWVAYAMNEITKHKPEPRYFEFAMRNVKENLPRIYRRKTSFHTFLELLTISWETYRRLEESDIELPYMKNFDVERFATTIYRRVRHMLNGYFYPEIAMYMKFPEQIEGSFMVKHHSYRTRIDDIQHFIGGYYFYTVYYKDIQCHINIETMDFDCAYPQVTDKDIDMRR